MDSLHPFDRDLLESKQRAKWIAKHEADKEYGRLLQSWMNNRGDGILQNWYLARIDGVRRIDSVPNDWVRLNGVFTSFRDETKFFHFVVGMEISDLALDKFGNWLATAHIALGAAISQIEEKNKKNSFYLNWLVLFGVLIVLALLRGLI